MVKTKEELKNIFVTGAKPTQQDFHDLIDGVEGPKGEQGLTGPKGDTGLQGPKGDVGAQGPKGEQGLKGDTGAQGPAGKDGAAGKDGKDGASITAIELAVDAGGKVTGGTATLSDATTINITVTEG